MTSPHEKAHQPTNCLCRRNARRIAAGEPSLKLDGGSQRVIRRASGAKAGKVGIASGGGGGHLPLFTGYVGEGLLDTCSIGNVFEGPNVESCEDRDPPRAQRRGRALSLRQLRRRPHELRHGLRASRRRRDRRRAPCSAPMTSPAPRPPRRTNVAVWRASSTPTKPPERSRKAARAWMKSPASRRRPWKPRAPSASHFRPVRCPPRARQLLHRRRRNRNGHGHSRRTRHLAGELKSADAIVDEMLERLLADRPIAAGSRVSVLVNGLVPRR